ncbi:MAG TPA: glycosyltransferase family 2 protein [Stenomitos sp.]
MKPRVSIGLPVYNGENYLAEALTSILNQTFLDFEVVISDNASTDRTAEICREFAAKDNRIRYYRNSENLGAGPNQNRVFELSKGEYFKWWAHDDLCDPEFLFKCVDVLDRDSSVVLCFSKVTVIGPSGEFIENFDGYNRLAPAQRHFMSHLSSRQVVKRFAELTVPHMCYPIFGLIRSEALTKTPLLGFYSAADNVLLVRLSLIGRFYELPEYLFYARSHAKQSMQVCTDHNIYAEWWSPKNKDQLVLPELKIFLEYIDAVRTSNLPLIQKLNCYAYLLPVLRRIRKPLFQEIVLAFNYYTARKRTFFTLSQKA